MYLVKFWKGGQGQHTWHTQDRGGGEYAQRGWLVLRAFHRKVLWTPTQPLPYQILSDFLCPPSSSSPLSPFPYKTHSSLFVVNHIILFLLATCYNLYARSLCSSLLISGLVIDRTEINTCRLLLQSTLKMITTTFLKGISLKTAPTFAVNGEQWPTSKYG